MIKLIKKLFTPKKLSRAEWWSEYQKYLKSDKWYKIRSKVLTRDKNRCTYRTLFIFRCKETKGLQVHHLHYRSVFKEHKDLKCLITLCDKHHKLEHIKKDKK